ncbi:MAG: tRNA A-37 threonylcarbamoyl transferase component Bud32 [Limisphaerales bacterium]|jgi:tRNA A-37 threonylcarbamoyl transferase component Bud32
MKFSVEGLLRAGLDLTPPFSVDLWIDPEGSVEDRPTTPLSYTKVARILPGRRLSGFANYKNEPVFAKLFYGKGARRYWSREIKGSEQMRRVGTRTPDVLHTGATSDNQGFVVLYEAIKQPASLKEDDLPSMSSAVDQVAKLHDGGLMQTDIHLDNFVVSAGVVHLVDADGVRPDTLLRRHFKNLALLLAQRGPWLDRDIPQLWHSYVSQRGEYVEKMGSAEQILQLTQQERRHRVSRYLAKTQRECTEFVQHKRFTRDFVCDREHWLRLQRFMVLPEVYLGEGVPLKLGNSATVVRCVIGGEPYVIKRYNIKSFGHRVRRWFKRRGRNAWSNGHWLAFLGIDTARPLALLERRIGWFAGVSYVVMPDIGDRDLGQVLSTEPESFSEIADQVVALLLKLSAANICHGDMKATNFIQQQYTDDDGSHATRIVLIDVDAVSEGSLDKDKARFLANWQNDPEMLSGWQQKFSEAGL